jgi:hypothetical protein
VRSLALIETTAFSWGGKALGGLGTENLPSLCPDSYFSLPRTPQEESLHHCPQIEALQQKLKLLEEENDHLREEVRTGRRACLQAGGGGLVTALPLSLSLPSGFSTRHLGG